MSEKLKEVIKCLKNMSDEDFDKWYDKHKEYIEVEGDYPIHPKKLEEIMKRCK